MTDLDRQVTLSDVARHAGVSLATASRALNGSTRTVQPELRERVLESAAALRYTANVQAQAVARGTSRMVAIVLGDVADPYFAAIASGITTAAELRGLVVTMATTGSDVDRELATLRALGGQRPQAIVMAGSKRMSARVNDAVAAELAVVERMGGRVAFIGSPIEPFRSVRIANREGAADLARALAERGYRDFAILAGPADLATAIERTSGFSDALTAAGVDLPPARILHGPFSRQGGYDVMAALIASGERPECVFAATDVMALGVMAAIRDAGLSVGDDIAVAGFDDIPMLRDVTPALSTVVLPLFEMGARALEVALAPEGSEDAPAEPVTGTVALRASTPGPGR